MTRCLLALLLLVPLNLLSRDYALYYPITDSLQIGVTGVPYAAYSTDKGSSFGLSIFFFEKNMSADITPGQNFRMRIDGELSTEKDRSFSINSGIPLRKHNQKINVDLEYKSNYNNYYGIGGNTPKEPIMRYQKERYTFKGDWVNFFFENLSVGVAWDLSRIAHKDSGLLISNSKHAQKKTEIITKEHSEQVNDCSSQRTILNSQFYRAFGIGAVFTLNNKLPNNFPESGYYYKSQFLYYDKTIYSDYNFFVINQEFHLFFKINKHIIANQIVSENTFKDTPLDYLTRQGGAYLMRGIKTGRHTNEQLLGGQVEYRSPIIIWRISAVCFGATAISYKKINDFKEENVHFTGGFGVRFAVDKSERVNLRADIGFSAEGPEVYLKFGEAF